MKILHGGIKSAVLATLIFTTLTPALAQSTSKKSSKGPRAVAIVEWYPSGPRLKPVSIMVDGKFYDAAIYLGNPVPMALDEGNIYELQKSGQPAGLFTIKNVFSLQGTGTYYATGSFQTQAQVEAAAKRAVEAKARRSSKAQQRISSEDSGPPVLRRSEGSKQGKEPPSSSPSPQGSPSSTSGNSGDNESGRPTMKRKDQDTAASSAPQSTDDDDSGRPTLKHEEHPAPPPQPSVASAPPADDTERPMLKRGTEGQQVEKLETNPSNVKTPTPAPKAEHRIEVAVSDATQTAVHPFAWTGKADVEASDEKGTREIAFAAVRDYAAKHPGLKPGTVMQDIQVHALDLDYSNSPVFVLSATVPEAPARPTKAGTKKTSPEAAPAQNRAFYVTVVARENYDGTMRRVFAFVTDTTHLDVYPRVQLIDAVDADGDGRGELLFRQNSDSGQSYAIYRAGVERLDELYNSGQPLQQ